MRIYKRGNRWWICEYKNGKTIRRSLGSEVKTQEQAFSVASGQPLIPELTLKELFSDFLIEARIRLAPASVTRYQRSFKTFMLDIGDFFPVTQLTSRHLNQWAADRLDKGRSPEGINLDLRHIRAALRRAENQGSISKAPKVDMVRTSKRLPRHLSRKDFNSIISAETREDFKRLWIFLVWTGLRRSEAHNLDWRDVSLCDNPTISVIGKGSRERVVPLLSPALEAMGKPKEFGAVFSLGSPDNFTNHFKSTVKKAGLPNARLHDLRHTCLTFLVGQGIPLKLVQDIAGHSSINTTMRYAKIFTGNAHEVLNKAFGF